MLMRVIFQFVIPHIHGNGVFGILLAKKKSSRLRRSPLILYVGALSIFR